MRRFPPRQSLRYTSGGNYQMKTETLRTGPTGSTDQFSSSQKPRKGSDLTLEDVLALEAT